MLCRMAFQLSGKVDGLQLDNSTAKAYLCNQDGTVFLFLSTLACHILSLTSKHDLTYIHAYIPTYLNVKADCLLWGKLAQECHFLPCIAQAAFQL